MPLFWSLAALLVAATLAALLWPLLRKTGRSSAPEQADAAIAVLRDQKRALDAESASGAISSAERDAALAELTRRVAEETSAPVAATTPSSSPSRAWPIALALLIVVPVASIALYMRLGNPDASLPGAGAGAPHEVSQAQIVAMVDKLAQKLKQRPDDPDGWILLAHSYQALERFPEAADAYAHADSLIRDNPGLIADYADALAMAQGGKLAGEPARLVDRALALDPKEKKALALAATFALETRDFDGSIRYWRRLAAELTPGSDEARQVDGLIAEVEATKREGKGGPAGSPAPARSEATAQASASTARASANTARASISGRVDLSPSLASRVALSDTVFIYARAANGARVPLAVLRLPAKELPRNFTLDDSMAMAPGAKLSAADSVVVEARISKSGNAIPQPGDFFGKSAPVKPGADSLAITIDQVVP